MVNSGILTAIIHQSLPLLNVSNVHPQPTQRFVFIIHMDRRRLWLRRKSRSCINQKVADSNPWVPQLHVKVSLSKTVNPKLLLICLAISVCM